MNKLYSEASLKIKRLEANQISCLHQGALVAAAVASISDLIAIDQDQEKIVVLDTLLDRVEQVLNMSRDELQKLFTVLQDSGLLKVEIEPEKKRQIVRLDAARKLANFVQFVRDAKHGSARKLLRAKFSHKETRVLSAIVKFAARLGLELEKTCKLTVRDLERSLEKATGVRFELDALQKGIDFKLLAIKEEGGESYLVLRPAHLGRTIACLEAIRKLSALEAAAPASP